MSVQSGPALHIGGEAGEGIKWRRTADGNLPGRPTGLKKLEE